jgi:hypothetical protein
MRSRRDRISGIIFIAFLFCNLLSFSQTDEETALFVLKGVITSDNKPQAGVSLVLTKNEKEITTKITSQNGKFNIEINQNTVNPNSNYVLVISKPGFVSKTLNINTYIPPAEYDDNEFVYTLEVSLLATKVNDIILKRPFGKIKWNSSLGKYDIDQQYYQAIAKEETLLKEDPDKYLLELAAKAKLEEEAKKKLAAEKAGAEEEKKKAGERIAALAKIKADSIMQYNLVQKQKNELQEQQLALLKKKALADSLLAMKKKDDVTKPIAVTQKTVAAKSETLPVTNPRQQFEKPAKEVVEFNGALHYSVNEEKTRIQNVKRKMDKNKAENLATKYETHNMSTSLMDAVDAYDKKMKH